MPKETVKKPVAKKPELVKLPNLNQNYSEVVTAKDADSKIVFRINLASLDRLLHMYRFAKDDKSTDLQVFYTKGSLIFLKEQLDATKSGAVPVELVEGEAENVLFNLDYALLQQVQSTMKNIEKDSLVMELLPNNSVNYIIGSFNLPGRLKDTTLELPYSKLDSVDLSLLLPSSDLRKVLDISYNTTESSHNALDNVFISPDYVVGGTKGLLFRTDTLLKGLEEVIGFNYKYAQDIAAFYSLITGEVNIAVGTSVIRGEERKVLELVAYDCRLTIPLSRLTDGDIGMFNALSDQLSTDSAAAEDIEIHCTVKAAKRSLQCMELALYGLKTSHKSTIEVDKSKVIVSATPLTNERATDELSCSVKSTSEHSKVSLGNAYLFSALDSYEMDDNIIIVIPAGESPSRVKIYGKTKSGNTKSWITSVYQM